MEKPKIKAVRVHLDDEQTAQIKPMLRLVREASDAGKPGFLCAQVFADEMFVFFIDHERALKFQELMGQKVGQAARRPRTKSSPPASVTR